jgi:hypothetical protein
LDANGGATNTLHRKEQRSRFVGGLVRPRWSFHFTLKKKDQVLVSFQDSIAFIPAKYDKRGDGTARGDSFP